MADTAEVVSVKPKKLRSPGYPYIDLGTAIKRTEAFYDKEKRNSAPLRIAALHWGTTEKSSTAMLTAAALKSFGLMTEIDGADRRLQLSDLALKIILDTRDPSPEREQNIKRAALMPKLHQMLWSKYGDALPSDGNLRHELIFECRFNENTVADFIREFKTTITYAKLGSSDKLSTEGSDSDDSINGDLGESAGEIDIGDYVQWQSQGVLQFPEPKRVRALSEDANWAFVDGSEVGLPIKELSIMETPNLERQPLGPATAPPRLPIPSGAPEAPSGFRQDVYSLDEGQILVQWPASISEESLKDLSDWLEIVKRKIGRSSL